VRKKAVGGGGKEMVGIGGKKRMVEREEGRGVRKLNEGGGV
jgi:hypothetical protein